MSGNKLTINTQHICGVYKGGGRCGVHVRAIGCYDVCDDACVVYSTKMSVGPSLHFNGHGPSIPKSFIFFCRKAKSVNIMYPTDSNIYIVKDVQTKLFSDSTSVAKHAYSSSSSW